MQRHNLAAIGVHSLTAIGAHNAPTPATNYTTTIAANGKPEKHQMAPTPNPNKPPNIKDTTKLDS